MTKGFLVAAAMAGGLLLTTLAPHPAAAVPMVKADMAKAGGVTLVKGGHGGGHGGRGGMRGGGHHRSFGGGGRHRSFGGGGRRRSFGGGGRRKSFGGYSGGGRKSFRRGHRGRSGRRHRHRNRAYYLPYVPYYYYDDYGYGDDCAWLRRKALRTDSSYWWRRYDECRYDY